jgi:hypothetical protein
VAGYALRVKQGLLMLGLPLLEPMDWLWIETEWTVEMEDGTEFVWSRCRVNK